MKLSLHLPCQVMLVCPSFMLVLLLALEFGKSFFVSDLTKNPEIEIYPNEFRSISRDLRLGLIMNTKFGMNIFNNMLLNNVKCQA